MKRAALVLALALALTGCASSPAAEEDGTTTTTPAAEEDKPTPTSTPIAKADALVLCELMAQKLFEYPGYVLAIANGEFDQVTHGGYYAWAEEMKAVAPADANVPLAKFTDPIYQVQEVVDAGGGSLTFNTDDYKAGNLEIMEYCVDAGFKVNN
ncbi:hypothetical protein [Microbacterium wangruii]|uniref:hypothetical protein n=1 Tax=Microbacterium wangruii TaxID=3049073 RepID=UPI00256F0FBC|nr:hypothetical protein [Microbacterium sp. zg-Y1211]MDL5485942.1 hypothetical protein [Microbacterium sp. zg-Y1211]